MRPPLRDLTRLEKQPPVGPRPASASSRARQGRVGRRRAAAWSCVERRPRRRGCLLKGCGRRFVPIRPLDRYCSPGCRKKAASWSAWKAGRKYRRSRRGKEVRREQSRRHRARRKEAEACEVVVEDVAGSLDTGGPAATLSGRAQSAWCALPRPEPRPPDIPPQRIGPGGARRPTRGRDGANPNLSGFLALDLRNVARQGWEGASDLGSAADTGLSARGGRLGGLEPVAEPLPSRRKPGQPQHASREPGEGSNRAHPDRQAEPGPAGVEAAGVGHAHEVPAGFFPVIGQGVTSTSW